MNRRIAFGEPVEAAHAWRGPQHAPQLNLAVSKPNRPTSKPKLSMFNERGADEAGMQRRLDTLATQR